MADYSEAKRRSFFKAVSWRIVATLVTLATAYAFTQKASQSLGIAVVAAVVNVLTYYFHERIWNRIGWGKTKENHEL